MSTSRTPLNCLGAHSNPTHFHWNIFCSRSHEEPNIIFAPVCTRAQLPKKKSGLPKQRWLLVQMHLAPGCTPPIPLIHLCEEGWKILSWDGGGVLDHT